MAGGRDALTGSVTKGSVLSDCQISVHSTEQGVRPGPPCTPSPLTIPTSSSVLRAGGGGGTQLALPSSRKAMSSRGGHLLVVQSRPLQRKASGAFLRQRNPGAHPEASHSSKVTPPRTDSSQPFPWPPCLSLPMETPPSTFFTPLVT